MVTAPPMYIHITHHHDDIFNFHISSNAWSRIPSTADSLIHLYVEYAVYLPVGSAIHSHSSLLCVWIVLPSMSCRKLTAIGISLSNNGLLHDKFHSQPPSWWPLICWINLFCWHEIRNKLGYFVTNEVSPSNHLSSQNIFSTHTWHLHLAHTLRC